MSGKKKKKQLVKIDKALKKGKKKMLKMELKIEKLQKAKGLLRKRSDEARKLLTETGISEDKKELKKRRKNFKGLRKKAEKAYKKERSKRQKLVKLNGKLQELTDLLVKKNKKKNKDLIKPATITEEMV